MQSRKNVCFEAIQGAILKQVLQARTEVYDQAEKCEPREIYRKMCEVYREAYFFPKSFHKYFNMGLPLRAWVEKTVLRVETHRLPGKENLPGAALSKNVSFLEYERTYPSWFLVQGVIVNNATYWQLFKQNSPYLLDDSCRIRKYVFDII